MTEYRAKLDNLLREGIRAGRAAARHLPSERWRRYGRFRTNVGYCRTKFTSEDLDLIIGNFLIAAGLSDGDLRWPARRGIQGRSKMTTKRRPG